MASTIKIKRSDTQGSVPSGLAVGEIAVNLFDRKLYVGNTAAGVSAIGGEDFRLTSQTAGEGAYIRLIGDQAPSSNNVLLRGGSAITIGKDANGSISVAHDGTLQTVATSKAYLANTNARVASVESSVSTNAATELSHLANTNARIATVESDVSTNAATELSHLANTNAYIATKLDSSSYTTADVRSKAALANTNAYIATKLDSSSYTTADVRSKAALANTNAYIASTLASAQNLAGARLGATATVTLTGDVTGSASFSGNTVSIATTYNNDVVLGTDTSGNFVAGVSGTTNEIEVTGSGSENATVTIGLPNDVTIGNDLTVTNNLGVSGDVTVDGNLTVEGAVTYISSSTVNVDDSAIKLAANNAADTVDIGMYGKYIDGATAKYSGWFRDASDSGVIKFYTETQTEPTTTVDTGATGFALAQIDCVIDGGTY